MSLSKASFVVDSWKPFLNDYLPRLRKMEKILSYLGIFFVGKFLLTALYDIVNGIRIHFISRLFRKNFTKRYGKWAVVTGCTDGVGRAYCDELAKQNMNIVLISRNETKLKNTALELTTQYGIEAETIQADFLEGRPVFAKIEENLKNKEIGILVNNVAIMLDRPKAFLKSSDDEVWGHININMATVPALMKMVMPSMIARKKGAIVNIASVAAYCPLPYLGIYSASKAFVKYFSEACIEEYPNSGITFQILVPSYIATKMISYNHVFTKSSLLFPSAQKYASNAVNTLGYSQVTTGYWLHGTHKWCVEHLIPKFIYIDMSMLMNRMVSPDKIDIE